MTSRWAIQLTTLRRVAFDSNAVIYGVERRDPYASLVAEAFRAMQTGALTGVLSTVVEIETLVKPLRDRDQDMLDAAERFFLEMPGLTIRDVDRPIAQRAAALRAQRRLSLADAIIAATAIEEKCDAVIGNDADMAARVIGIPYLYLDNYIR